METPADSLADVSSLSRFNGTVPGEVYNLVIVQADDIAQYSDCVIPARRQARQSVRQLARLSLGLLGRLRFPDQLFGRAFIHFENVSFIDPRVILVAKPGDGF